MDEIIITHTIQICICIVWVWMNKFFSKNCIFNPIIHKKTTNHCWMINILHKCVIIICCRQCFMIIWCCCKHFCMLRIWALIYICMIIPIIRVIKFQLYFFFITFQHHMLVHFFLAKYFFYMFASLNIVIDHGYEIQIGIRTIMNLNNLEKNCRLMRFIKNNI